MKTAGRSGTAGSFLLSWSSVPDLCIPVRVRRIEMGEIKKYTEREGKPYPDALIWNPSGESALSAYIDLKRMDSDPHYNWLVYYGMLNPTWNGIILPEGKTLSWRQLAECMRKDHFRAAPEVEIIADMTEMAGERCPLMRLPMT